MRRIPIALFTVLLIAGCGSENGEKKIISVEKKTVYKEAVPVVPNRELTIEISGMSCEHACGGAIRTALKNTNAVERCSFDFKADRKVNTAVVTFDKDKISPDKILSIIQLLNDGQFTTGKTSTRTIEAPAQDVPAAQTSTSEKEKVTTTKTVDVSTTSVELPNLFDLFAEIII